jgi:hypothetical protein
MQHDSDASQSAPPASQSEPGDLLGKPIRVFRPRPAARLTVALSALIIGGGGLCLVIYDFTQGIIYSFGWMAFWPGLLALVLAYFMGKSRYVIGEGGVLRIHFGYALSCTWAEIREIIDLHTKQSIVSSRSCVLATKAGPRIVLQDLGIGDFSDLIDLVRKQAATHGIPWREERAVK